MRSVVEADHSRAGADLERRGGKNHLRPDRFLLCYQR